MIQSHLAKIHSQQIHFKMKRIIEIGVGTENQLKIEAVRNSFDFFSIPVNITPVPVPQEFNIGVRKQPMGLEEIMLGASNRATYPLRLFSKFDFGLGLENGGMSDMLPDARYYDIAGIEIRDRKGNRGTSLSQGIEIPRRFIERSILSGYSKTIGELMAEEVEGLEHGNPQDYLTLGFFPREQLLTSAICAAILNHVVLRTLIRRN
jgi:non-canonical (house-cleaning) NTP pyrophosphatase